MDTSKGKYWDKALSWVEGCTPVSEGCKHCWLRAINDRFRKGDFSKVEMREDRLDIPLKRKTPSVYAVWADLFHPAVNGEFILKAYQTMGRCFWHTYLLLTKRPERIAKIHEVISPILHEEGRAPLRTWSQLWHGTTCENQAMADKRIPELLKVPGKKFLSIEPLLGEINLHRIKDKNNPDLIFDSLSKKGGIAFRDGIGINAVIVGAESGPGARECKIEWVRSIVEQCKAAGVPVFVKQLHINGKLSKNMQEWPEDLRVRELPWIK